MKILTEHELEKALLIRVNDLINPQLQDFENSHLWRTACPRLPTPCCVMGVIKTDEAPSRIAFTVQKRDGGEITLDGRFFRF